MNCICQELKTIRIAASLTLLIITAGAAVPARGQTPTTIYTFTGNSTNPAGPANPNNNSVAQGRNGNYYFTTCIPLSTGSVLFNIKAAGTPNTTYVPPNCSYGVALGSDGNLYSTTGNNDGAGGLYGTVYKVTPGGTATTLHTFTNGADGSYPYCPPVEGTNGVYYSTTQAQVTNSTFYSVTSTGTFTTLHTFTGTDGQNVNCLTLGTDGNFYGSSQSGGTSGDGVIFKITPTGVVTVLHNFAGSDGSIGRWNLTQAKNGDFYGVTLNGGTYGGGVLFRITGAGSYTVLYNFPLTGNPSTGDFPLSGLIQATNGLLYGVTGNTGGPWAFGAIYSYDITTATFTTLYSFTGGTDGGQPIGPLIQLTNGLIYGTTYVGGDGACNTVEYDGELVGVGGCGTVFTFDINAKPFASLVSTSGREGATIGIRGQGFSSSSVVKFGGTQAAKVALAGSTFLEATVPAGALTGAVTVTAGSTTLTGNTTFRVTPTFASFSPSSGPVGQSVTINGTGLMQATKVTFNGTSASFTVISDIEITATVPTGATTGKIKVATEGGSVANATSFTVN